ncbi:MAG: response regulator [Acidobacteriota bacterium]|nr:response regulator [Acidobacteriota bacterium]
MSKTILLADDSVTIRKVVELTFMDEDYELDSVGSGEEALERLEVGTPDLVIADVHMSGVSGYEVCRHVKESESGAPVLLLVGTFEPFEEKDVEECGADRYLKKPFDSQELLQTVRELLAGEVSDGAEESAMEGAAESQPFVTSAAPELTETVDVSPAVGEAVSEAAQDDWEGDFVETSPVPVVAVENDEGAVVVESAKDTPMTEISDETVDRIARRVAELLANGAVRDVAWEVVPDLAEVVIKERLRELESQVE